MAETPEIVLTYANAAQVEAYLTNYGGDWSELTDNQIWISEQDIDDAIMLPGPQEYMLGTGLKIDPTLYTTLQAQWLQEAVAEQVKYRMMMPAAFFETYRPKQIVQEGVNVTHTGHDECLAPKALEKLVKAGFLNAIAYSPQRAWSDTISRLDQPCGPSEYHTPLWTDGSED